MCTSQDFRMTPTHPVVSVAIVSIPHKQPLSVCHTPVQRARYRRRDRELRRSDDVSTVWRHRCLWLEVTLRLLVVGPGRVWIDRAEPVAIVSSELHSETCESVTHRLVRCNACFECVWANQLVALVRQCRVDRSCIDRIRSTRRPVYTTTTCNRAKSC